MLCIDSVCNFSDFKKISFKKSIVTLSEMVQESVMVHLYTVAIRIRL